MAICAEKPSTTHQAFKVMERSIAQLAHSYTKGHYQDFNDLFQEGCIGLMKAYDQFDPNAGMAFSSYAYRKIQAEINTRVKENWDRYNKTSSKDIDTAMNNDAYELDLDSKIDLERKIDSQDETTQVIIRARIAGYSFREISEMLEKEGVNKTLHQCRTRYIEIMGE